jgi:hypothetical protein
MDAPGLEVRFARSEHERDDAEDVLVRALGGAGAQALCGQPRTTADRARCRRELDLALARPELAGDIKGAGAVTAAPTGRRARSRQLVLWLTVKRV